MSNRLAIAAVTSTLRNLLASALAGDADLSDTIVTAQPLDRARDASATANQLNLFLYMISPSAAWRNQDMPGRTRPGEVASPPLALNLFYLISAYGRDNDAQQPFSQLLLGQAMSALYDHPLLGHDEIASALPGNDLGDQPERVRITLQPLSIEEISKLWAGFQMQYRLSVAYEAAVVLIDPSTPVRAGPPVLARGPGGTGFPAGADPFNAFPQIIGLAPNRPLRIGDTVSAHGGGLAGAVTARFTPITPEAGRQDARPTVDMAATPDATGGGFSATLPAGANLAAGAYMVSLLFAPPDLRVSNGLPLAVAPRITSALPIRVAVGAGDPSVTLDVDPPVLPGQRVALILGSLEVPAPSPARPTSRLTFVLSGAKPGTYLARVRVEGIDSLPFVDPDAPVPAFDPAQTIEVTP